MKMAVKPPSSVIWTPRLQRRRRTALFALAAVAAVVMSSLNVSNAVDDLHFYCDKAVRHKYCGGGNNGADRDREWVIPSLQHFCDTITLYLLLTTHASKSI